MNKPKIIISEAAQKYLQNITKNKKNIILYLSLIYPFTKYAYININLCNLNEVNKQDKKISINNIIIYVEQNSINSLHNSTIDIKDGKLLINIKQTKEKKISQDEIKNKIKYLLENEINVMLSQHGGFIELIDVINNNTIVIKFHGGCQGCGMVGYTLNSYIEKIIKKHFPQITNIKDVTAHDIKTYAYY